MASKQPKTGSNHHVICVHSGSEGQRLRARFVRLGLVAVSAGILSVACAGPGFSQRKAWPLPGADASLQRDRSRPRAAWRSTTVAPKRPVETSFFGVRVTDDYEWLERGDDPEVEAFTRDQNAQARRYLDALPEREQVRGRVETLLRDVSVDYIDVSAVRTVSRGATETSTHLFSLVSQPPKQQPVLVVMSASPSAGAPRAIVDPNLIDPSGRTTIDFFVPSPNGSLVAVSLSKNGSERGDVYVYDVATGSPLPDVLRHVHGGTAGGSLAWNADGTAFVYTRYPDSNTGPQSAAAEHVGGDADFYQQIYIHTLGTPVSSDEYVLGRDFPKIAEVHLARNSEGSQWLARVANGDGGEFETYVVHSRAGASPRRAADLESVKIASFSEGLVASTFGPDGAVWGVRRGRTPRGSLVVYRPPFQPNQASEVVLEEGQGVMESITVTHSAAYVTEIVGGPSRVRRLPLHESPQPLASTSTSPPTSKGAPRSRARIGRRASKLPGNAVRMTTMSPKPSEVAKAVSSGPVVPAGSRGGVTAELPIPTASSVSSVVALDDDLLLRIESYVEPPAWYKYVSSEHRLEKTAMAKTSAVDMRDIEVVRESCVSSDGTRIPMSVLKPKHVPANGTSPALLTGYGGFGLSRKPRMRAWHRAWFDRGGVIAEANLRGGGEFGDAWHEAGRKLQKQNVFDDFAACARTLVDKKLAAPERLAAMGRSNGGLLMGVFIVQHPELFRAVVSGVGIYDMLRVEQHPNGAFNVTEYGTVKDQAQFRALYAYSPLHNVKNGVAYPAVLFTTGAHDPRVDPYHSRKMTARLQDATSSGYPVLLRTDSDTGHGMGTPLSAEIDETTDMLAFLFHEVFPPAR